jgi:hypothetical protein
MYRRLNVDAIIRRLTIQLRQNRALMGKCKHGPTIVRYKKTIESRKEAIKYLEQNPETNMSMTQLAERFKFKY